MLFNLSHCTKTLLPEFCFTLHFTFIIFYTGKSCFVKNKRLYKFKKYWKVVTTAIWRAFTALEISTSSNLRSFMITIINRLACKNSTHSNLIGFFKILEPSNFYCFSFLAFYQCLINGIIISSVWKTK